MKNEITSLLLSGFRLARQRCAAAFVRVQQTLVRSRRAALLLGAGVLAFAAPRALAIPTWYTIGDSTVQTYASGYYPRAGWGQVIPSFFDSTKVAIVNKAVGGTSSKSFYDSFWAPVRDGLKAGDYVTIQFGINDSATDTARHTDPFTTFEDYLTKFVNETKAKGAFPILVSTQNRNAWNATTPPTVYAAYHDYPVATRQLAGQLGVPLIDLDARCKTLLESVGPTYSTNFIYNHYLAGEWANYPSGNSDDVHFQEMGAIEMAKLVVAGVRALSGDANVSKLIPFIRPTFKVTFNSNNSAAGLVTRTEFFPQGVTVTAYVWPNSGYTFSSWSGAISGTKRNTQFVMGTSALTITANFTAGGPPIANGTYSIKNVASGKMLDNLGSTADSAGVGQYTDGTSNNQKWVVTNVSGSIYKISCVTGGKYLDSLGHTTDGSTVGQFASSSSNNQRWTVTASGSSFKIINVANGKCLDTGGQTANSAIMQFWPSGGSSNQLWQFVAP